MVLPEGRVRCSALWPEFRTEEKLRKLRRPTHKRSLYFTSKHLKSGVVDEDPIFQCFRIVIEFFLIFKTKKNFRTRIRILILLKVSDPTGSGTERIRIHNTVKKEPITIWCLNWTMNDFLKVMSWNLGKKRILITSLRYLAFLLNVVLKHEEEVNSNCRPCKVSHPKSMWIRIRNTGITYRDEVGPGWACRGEGRRTRIRPLRDRSPDLTHRQS